MQYQQPEIPEGINVSQGHPLREFFGLSAVVLAAMIAITAAVSLSIDYLAEQIPFSSEKVFVRAVAERFDNRDAIDNYLQSQAEKLYAPMGFDDDMKVTLHYVDEDVVNAGATLGGHIFVYRGILEKMPDENSLMMLLAHEMAHIQRRHPIKGMGKGLLLAVAFSLLFGQSNDLSSQVVNGAGALTLMHFGRDHERESDALALAALNNYYGHTAGALSLFDILQQNGSHVPEYMSTHPLTEHRVDGLNLMIAKNGWNKTGERRPLPAAIIDLSRHDVGAP